MTFLDRSAKFLKSFRRRDDGAIAVQFAFLALPVAVLAFGMVDVNRASVAKKDLQDALDAATLIAGRSMALTSEDLQIIGEAALKGQLAGMGDATLVSSSFVLNGSNITSTAKVKLAPIVANLWLNQDMEVGAGSQIVRSMNKLEVAMVLDTTGSMKGSKLTNLKDAATDFVNQLSTAASRSTEINPVKIGIVPFSNAVRIAGTSAEVDAYQKAAWMDVNGNAPASRELFWNPGASEMGYSQNRFKLFENIGKTWGGCVESREDPYDVQDTAPSNGTPATQFTPYFWPDEMDDQEKNYSNDNNYLDDESKPNWDKDKWKRFQGNVGKYDQNVSDAGPNKGCDMQPVMRLTTNWTALKDRIDDLNAEGETHIPLGMIWGWHLLSPNAPFSDGVPYSTPRTTKVVVLMTDGENTYGVTDSRNKSNYDGYGFAWQGRTGTKSESQSDRTTAINNRLALLCTNMKNAGIVIYTVRVEVKTGSSALLKNCATSADKFYDVQSASNLSAVFSAIAGSIENLRITQ